MCPTSSLHDLIPVDLSNLVSCPFIDLTGHTCLLWSCDMRAQSLSSFRITTNPLSAHNIWKLFIAFLYPFSNTHINTHTLTVQTIHTCFMPLNRNVTFLWNNVLNGVLSSPVPSQNYILSKYLILVLLLQMQLCMCMCMCVCLMFAHHMVNSRMSDWAWFFHPYVLVSSTLLGT